MTEVKISDLLAGIRSGRTTTIPSGVEIVGVTPLDYLAMSAPAAVPGWFRDEFHVPTGVPVPESVDRYEKQLELHDKQFRQPDGTADWSDRRAASVEAVNALAKLSATDSAAYARACRTVAGRDEAKLAIRWRYWWAHRALEIRDEVAGNARAG